MNPRILFSALLAALGPASSSAANRPDSPDLVAHEWGTFTAVVGSDGTEVPWWTPVLEGPAALPEFVRQAFPLVGKSGAGTLRLLRMETPVIYFYSDTPHDLTVTVDSSKIRTTEVYPSLAAGGLFNADRTEWRVRLAPPSDPVGKEMPLVGARGAHYAHARNVPGASWVVSDHSRGIPREVEKFLFYRGVGNVVMPKRVLSLDDDSIELVTAGQPVFLIESDGSTLRWKQPAWDSDGETKSGTFALPSADPNASTDETSLAASLVSALQRGGLSPDEASAMVETWREAWLGERGLRILEILPREWVDQTLPLAIAPAPTKLERVFVARWELITPKTEAQVLKALELTGTSEDKLEALRKLDLRRFGAAAFERAAAMRDATFRTASRELISALNATPVATTVSQ